jgi:putative transposase
LNKPNQELQVDYAQMPNHFHLVVWPLKDKDLGEYMQWLLTTHVRRYHKHYQSSGHVWQGRFKAFPIQEDDHLLAVLRYVERNAMRAGLVPRAEEWRWSSLRWWQEPGRLAFLNPGPVPRPANWVELVNEPATEEELKRLRQSVERGCPYGQEQWVKQTAASLGLESTLRPRGRPSKQTEEEIESSSHRLF